MPRKNFIEYFSGPTRVFRRLFRPGSCERCLI